MGFLSQGETLTWEEAKKHADYIREHGILQFLALLKSAENRAGDPFLWGDEIEYFCVKFEDHEREVYLNLRAGEVLLELARLEEENPDNPDLPALWRPEYGRFMLESTPGTPFCSVPCFDQVELNMRLRRTALESLLQDNEGAFTLSHFALMGTPNSTHPPSSPMGPIANSFFTSDDVINAHKRFGTLTKNIRQRRGAKVAINVPLFFDKNTKPIDYSPYFPNQEPSTWPALPNHIYADSMAFGMGQSCLQCTFQCLSIQDARMLYDTLVPFAPIALALTASTPILRGYLADWDTRWNTISAAVDDRTEEERGLKPLQNDRYVISKSRYASVSCYIDNDSRRSPIASPELAPLFNDLPLSVNEEARKMLLDAGVDPVLAQHIGHLFIRDPLVIYDNAIEIDDEKRSDHFENIQSTNWQTVRWKPPPPPPNKFNIGWRVEFRPMEAQITDFESAAYVIFIVLVTRVIQDSDLNFYMPLSQVDANMQRAHHKDAVLNEKFYFRTNIRNHSSPQIQELTVNEIINGSSSFTGIIPLIREWLAVNGTVEKQGVDCTEQLALVDKYLELISKRASGQLLTNAAWMRKFVVDHPEYQQDSVVSQPIVYDLLKTIDKIEKGIVKEPLLFGDLYTPLDASKNVPNRRCQ